MTVSTQTARVVYQGNGSTSGFSVPFRFVRDQDLRIILCSEDGIENELTLTTDYTVSGAGDATGGSVTLEQAPAATETLAILRDPDLVQETDYQENDAFPAETHEAALDLLTMIAQANRERIDRAVKLPVSSTLTDLYLPHAEADRALVWNADADGLGNGPSTDQIESAQEHAVAAANAGLTAQAARDAALSAQAGAEAALNAAQAIAEGAAAAVLYDNTASGLDAEDVQAALDELAEQVSLERQMELGFFQLAENQAMSEIELTNKRLDIFEDDSNINGGASSGYTHDADNDLVTPTPGPTSQIPDLSAATHTDVKGSIAQFIVDTADTSGHFDAAVPSAVLAGCRMVINGTDYAIAAIADDGDAANDVVFEGVLAAGTYTVSGIYGTVYETGALKLSTYVDDTAYNAVTVTTAMASSTGTFGLYTDTDDFWDGDAVNATYSVSIGGTVIIDFGEGNEKGLTKWVVTHGTSGAQTTTWDHTGAHRYWRLRCIDDFPNSGAASGAWAVEYSDNGSDWTAAVESWAYTANSVVISMGVYESPAAVPANQFYCALLPAIDHAVVADISSAAVTCDDGSETLVFAVSFDGGATWKGWDGDSWEAVALSAETGWMTEATLEGVADTDWPAFTGDIVVAVGFKTATASADPSLSGFTLNVVGQVADMDLIMEPVDATDAPATARVFAVLRDVDTLTLNTDLKAWASRDDGSSWDQITLAKVSDFLTDSYTAEGELSAFTHADGGSDQAVFRLTSHNNKDFELRFLSQGIGV